MTDHQTKEMLEDMQETLSRISSSVAGIEERLDRQLSTFAEDLNNINALLGKMFQETFEFLTKMKVEPEKAMAEWLESVKRKQEEIANE